MTLASLQALPYELVLGIIETGQLDVADAIALRQVRTFNPLLPFGHTEE